jgi:O-antigen/teichoic acid export membrane protein
MDTVMLGFMRSDAEVGYYNAAYKVIFLFIMVISCYLNSVFPVMANYYNTSIDSLKKLQSYTIKLMITVGIPIAVGGTILAKSIINLLYGSKYEEGVPVFQILIWALPLIFINATYGWGLWSCNKQKEYLKVVSIQALINLILNFILIPSFGLIGAAVATVIAELIGLPFYYIEFSKVIYVPFRSYLSKPIFASIIMGLFLFFASNGGSLNIFIIIIGGIFIYFTILCLIGGITKEEIAMVKNTVLANRG